MTGKPSLLIFDVNETLLNMQPLQKKELKKFWEKSQIWILIRKFLKLWKN